MARGSHFLSLELHFTISQKAGLQIDLQSPAGYGSVNEGLKQGPRGSWSKTRCRLLAEGEGQEAGGAQLHAVLMELNLRTLPSKAPCLFKDNRHNIHIKLFSELELGAWAPSSRQVSVSMSRVEREALKNGEGQTEERRHVLGLKWGWRGG